jgi:2-hydroxy-6-oxonona-2,4-dienedioate hydrolase
MIDNYRFHARVFATPGTRAHAPVLLLHGLGGSGRPLVPVAEQLAPYFDVYVPDLPGHGGSDVPPRALGVQGMAEWVSAWLALMGLRRVSIVSHGRGCQIAVELAVREPQLVERLVLIAPAMDRGSPYARGVRRLLGRVPRSRRAAAAARRIEDRLPRLTIPVMFVRGEWDWRSPQAWVDLLAEITPDSRVAVVSGAGVAVQQRAPESLARVIVPFLSESRISHH